MPGRMRKVKGGYQVRWGGRITARRTSKANATRQLRLLRGLQHGMVPRGRGRRRGRR